MTGSPIAALRRRHLASVSRLGTLFRLVWSSMLDRSSMVDVAALLDKVQ